MVLGSIALRGQSAPVQAPAAQAGDNPFPEDEPKPVPQTAQQSPKLSTSQQPANPSAKPQSDNPFPGEDTGAPIIPVDPAPTNTGNANSSTASRGSSDANGDPVRSPDGPVDTVDDGFSSSSSGLGDLPVDEDVKPRKTGKVKTREQMVKEDIDVGSFYSSRKNWKAALDRFSDAFKIDSENEDAVFGLAEAERHLENYDKAREHYELFLSYDPDGPHSKAARKALEEVV